MLAQTSTRASSLGEEFRVVIGQTNSESQTDRAEDRGSVWVSMGASHRLDNKRVSEPARVSNRARTKNNAAILD